MAARSAKGDESRSMRRCVVSRRSLPKEEMIRFVASPDGTLVPDIDGKLPGRGLWLSAERDMLDTACATNAFAKAARTGVEAPDGLSDRVEALLARRCCELLGLAKRAGQTVAGFEKVKAWLAEGKGAVLVEASDGAEGGRAKLGAGARNLPVVEALTGAELGSALGRERAVHVALAPGGLADSFVREAARLAGFRRAD